MTTTQEIRLAHEQLLQTAARLAEETDQLPAGVVLRSFSRAVRLARLAGCPAGQLPAEAERVARQMLALRCDARSPGTLSWKCGEGPTSG